MVTRIIFTAIVLSLIALEATAATRVKTVGATGADYAHLAAWVADLDDGTAAAIDSTAYGSGDIAVCELIDASYSGANNQNINMTTGGTVGLAGIIIRPASGNKHDGTIGSGCTLTISQLAYAFTVSVAIPITIEDLEFNGVGDGNYSFNYFVGEDTGAAKNVTIQRNLFRCDGVTRTSGGDCLGVFFNVNVDKNVVVQNNVFLNITRGSAGTGIRVTYGTGTGYKILNNTVIGCYQGIDAQQGGPTVAVQNNAAVSSVSADFLNPSNYDTATGNVCSDATHGTDTSQTLSQLFTNTTTDFTPLTGSDLIGAGTDLGTTPAGVNIDAKQRDRDAEGDTWDVGAIQTFADGSPLLLMNARNNMRAGRQK